MSIDYAFIFSDTDYGGTEIDAWVLPDTGEQNFALLMLSGPLLDYFFDYVRRHDFQYVIWDNASPEVAAKARAHEILDYFREILATAEAESQSLTVPEHAQMVGRLRQFIAVLETRKGKFCYVVMA